MTKNKKRIILGIIASVLSVITLCISVIGCLAYKPLCEFFSIPDFSDIGNPVYTPQGERLPQKFHVEILCIDEYMYWVYKLNEEEQTAVLEDIEKGKWSELNESHYRSIKNFDGSYGAEEIFSENLLDHECYLCVYDPQEDMIITTSVNYFCDDNSVWHSSWVIYLYDTDTRNYYCMYATM